MAHSTKIQLILATDPKTHRVWFVFTKSSHKTPSSYHLHTNTPISFRLMGVMFKPLGEA